MESTNNKRGSDLNIFAFWNAQKTAWKVTVIRTSLERFGYKLVLPYLSLYVILMGATKTQLGLVTSLGLVTAGLIGPWLGQQIDRHGPKKMYILGICILIFGYIAFASANVWQNSLPKVPLAPVTTATLPFKEKRISMFPILPFRGFIQELYPIHPQKSTS